MAANIAYKSWLQQAREDVEKTTREQRIQMIGGTEMFKFKIKNDLLLVGSFKTIHRVTFDSDLNIIDFEYYPSY